MIGLALGLIVGAAVLLLRIKFEGPDLGESVADMLNRGMRGQIEIQSIEWPAKSLPTLVKGGWIPLRLTRVSVWDSKKPDHHRLLFAPEITAEVDAHSLIFDQAFVFRNIVVHGGTVTLADVDEPYPLHAYDKTVVGLLAAFYPERKPGFSAGIYVQSAAVFDLRDFTLDDVHLDFKVGNYEVVTGRDKAGKDIHGTAYTFAAGLDHVKAHGFLYMDASDPLVPKFYFSLSDPDPKGAGLISDHVVIHLFDEPGQPPAYTMVLDQLAFKRLAQLPEHWAAGDQVANSLDVDAEARTHEGAEIAIHGGILDYWDRPFDGSYQIDIKAKNLGPTIHDVFTTVVSGDDVTGDFQLRGPYLALPRVSFQLHGLDVDLPMGEREPLRLTLDKLDGVIDNVNDQLKIQQTVARGAGGEVALAGTVQLSPLRVDGNLFVTKPLELAPWLPDAVVASIGSKLSGTVHVVGDVATTLQFDEVGLSLGRAHFGKKSQISADHYFDRIAFHRVRIDAGKTTATIDGSTNTREETIDVAVTAQSPDLAVWLRRLGVPVIAERGGGTLRISKTWGHPHIAGRVHAGGVVGVDDVAAGVSLDDGVLAVSGLSSSGLGGSLTGGGRIRLGDHPRVERFELRGKDLDVSKLPGTDGAVVGRISRAEVTASGPLDLRHLHLAGAAQSDELVVAGDHYVNVAMCLDPDEHGTRTQAMCEASRPRAPEHESAADHAARAEVTVACSSARARGGVCLTGRADRVGGGAVDMTAVTDAAGALRGAVDLVGLPLAGLLGAGAPAGGQLTTHLFLGGTVDRPTAEGAIRLARGWVLGGFLGDADIKVEPKGPGTVEMTGSVLQGRVAVVATVGTVAPYPATVQLDLRRVDLDPFVDLRGMLGLDDPVQAWASGQITVKTELGAKGVPPLDATVALSELAMTIDQNDADGRPAPLTVTAASPVRLRYHDGAVDLACVDQQPGAPPHVTPCPVVLSTPAGTLSLSGSASLAKLDLHATGTLDVRLLRPLLADYVAESGGSADLDVRVQGAATKPLINASLTMNDVWFRPLRQDTVIHLPEGTIGLKDNDDLGFTGMKLTVKDNYSGDVSEIDLGGGVKLADWRPVHWGVTVDGELPAKLLLAIAPESFSQASGVADLELLFQGYGPQPAISGRLTFDAKRPFSLVPRGVHREVVMSDGWVNIADQVAGAGGDPCHPPQGDPNARVSARRSYEIDLCDVGGSIDEEGHLHDIRGSLELVDWKLAGGDVTLRADGLPFRIPHELDVVLNADQVRIASDEVTHRWNLTGTVEIVDGRYTRRFDLGEVLRPAAPAAGSPKPFWEEYPALGAMNLDLTLDVRRFAVNNNIASIDMTGQLGITGTPRDPRLDGVIQVNRGVFRLPTSRAEFTRTSGSLTFSRLSAKPSESAYLALQSEADYTDPSGQTHLITLTIDGTLAQLNWDLSTSSGFNKGQTLTLIMSGRTPEQFRRQLGNDAVAANPNHIDPTTNPNDSYADQLIKDFAANFISALVEDQIKEVTKLDVARVEIGTGSIGFHGEKKVLDNLNVIGDLEGTIRGRTIYVRGELRTPYHLIAKGSRLVLQAGYLNKSFDDAAEEDISDPEVKLVYRFFIP